MSSKKDNPRDVLFFPSGSIGDALMMLALCAEIHDLEPERRFVVIARRNAGLIADMAAAYPCVTVVPIEKSLRGILTLVWQSFRRPVIALMPAVFGKSWFLNTGVLFYLLSMRPGTQTFGLIERATDRHPYRKGIAYDKSSIHFENMRNMARAAGLSVRASGAPLSFCFATLPATHVPFAEGSYVVFHPFGSSSWKSFPPRRMHDLIARFLELHQGYSAVITGGAENQAEAESIAAQLPPSRVALAINLPIREAAGVIDRAALYVGVDTGTTHVASVMGGPVVALEHNASPEWLPTYDAQAVILNNPTHCQCHGRKNDVCKIVVDGKPYLRCLYEISDETILGAIARILASRTIQK